MAAGESNAHIIKNALESEMTTQYPATALQRLENSRFYLTKGAASSLNDSVNNYYFRNEWNFEKTERAILTLCKKIGKYAHKLTLEDLQNDELCRMIPNLSLDTVNEVIESTEAKLKRGSVTPTNKTIYNSGPHHDDIMLGIMPLTNRQLRPASNNVHFAVMTSGYNSVTNGFLRDSLKMTLDFLEDDKIQMVHYPDFFEEGYKHKYDKDIYHYLDSVASDDQYQMNRGFCHRLLRCSVVVWQFKGLEELKAKYREVINVLDNCYDGEPNTPDLQQLKGMIREFEEELVWAYNGVQVNNVHHLHLGFYQDKGITKGVNVERDVMPILNQFREINPDIISVTLDPEGSGPDTHYKVLQATAAAVAEWSKEKDLSNLRIYGYRNVWFKFHPAEVNMYVPVSLNALAVLDKSFAASYLSQVKAEFPNPFHDGPFSDISKKTWINQLHDVQLLLGKNYFYENPSPLIRSTHGLIFIKDMNVEEFIAISEEMRRRSEEAI
jgi:glucosamine-6-phosphate deaminase